MKSRNRSVVVIGAGIAGLAAAWDLVRHGWRVTLLEARDRCGGRIHTVRSNSIPVELGAEFIHGRSKPLWHLVETASVSTHQVPDRHWEQAGDGSLKRLKFWQSIGKVMGRIDNRKPDQPFSQFIQSLHAPRHLQRLVNDFVEGFNAAHADRIGTKGLAVSEETSDRIEGTKQFRIEQGYGALVDWLVAELKEAGAFLYLGANVKHLQGKAGSVEIGFAREQRRHSLQASAAVITVPLGVLKSGALEVRPKFRTKAEVIAGLEFGAVTKVALHFRSRFWPRADFGFVHSFDEWLPTWWSDPRGNIVTGWAGGAKGERLATQNESFSTDRAVEALARIFQERPSKIRKLLMNSWTYNWSADPYSRGAYSYAPVNMSDAPKVLAEPLARTLFFAGEATSPDGQLGTVHGALGSGLRASRELRLP